MNNCCDILIPHAGELWEDSLEIKSTFAITLFACCTLGMVFSTTALILLILTALFFEEWRKVYKNQVLLQFMISRFFFTIIRYETDLHRFVYGNRTGLHRNYMEPILLTYTEITHVAWMFLFTKQMYDNFVRVLFVEMTLWKVSLAAWFVPIIITIILIFSCVYKKIANTIFFMIYLLIVKWPVLFVNGILLIIILRTILSDNKSRKIKNGRIVIVMILLILSFSLQQILWDGCKLLHTLSREDNHDYSPLVFKLTSITTVYQCAASIFFWLYGNKRTRILWGIQKEKLIKKQSSLTSVCTVQITKI